MNSSAEPPQGVVNWMSKRAAVNRGAGARGCGRFTAGRKACSVKLQWE